MSCKLVESGMEEELSITRFVFMDSPWRDYRSRPNGWGGIWGSWRSRISKIPHSIVRDVSVIHLNTVVCATLTNTLGFIQFWFVKFSLIYFSINFHKKKHDSHNRNGRRWCQFLILRDSVPNFESRENFQRKNLARKRHITHNNPAMDICTESKCHEWHDNRWVGTGYFWDSLHLSNLQCGRRFVREKGKPTGLFFCVIIHMESKVGTRACHRGSWWCGELPRSKCLYNGPAEGLCGQLPGCDHGLD